MDRATPHRPVDAPIERAAAGIDPGGRDHRRCWPWPIAKPWSLVATGSPAGAVSGSPIPPRPTRRRTPAIGPYPPAATPSGDPNAMACLADETEQVLTVERSAEREVRSWIAVPDLSTPRAARPATGAPHDLLEPRGGSRGLCRGTTSGLAPIGGPAGVGEASGAIVTDVQSITIVAGMPRAQSISGRRACLPARSTATDPALLYGPPPRGGARLVDRLALAPTTGAAGRDVRPAPSRRRASRRGGPARTPSPSASRSMTSRSCAGCASTS